VPLLIDLGKNKPLSMPLQKFFYNFLIPPYFVKEWRSLLENYLLDEGKANE
tara:strand:- start:613 stop:765 length:153 start_codon:yes stop_codon:yes gene_type:complete